MSRFRLYCGLVKGGTWYNETEVIPLQGGTLALLEGAEKSGAARLLNLMKGSVKSFYSASGEEWVLQPRDYEEIKVHDSWKIGYEQIKLKTGQDYPVIPESFMCGQCSTQKHEKYTKVNESWQKLIEDGYIDEFFLDKPDFVFDVVLAEPFEIPAGKIFAGGYFDTLRMQHINLGDMLKIHRNPASMESEANMIRATWDASIVGIKGVSESDFNRIMRVPGQSFSAKYLTSDENQAAIQEAIDNNIVGIDASRRELYCGNCGEPIRADLDFTNFFSPLLPKKSSQNR